MENLDSLAKIVGVATSVIALAALISAVFITYFKRNSRDQWREAAESRQAVIETLKQENAELEGIIVQQTAQLGECMKLRDEISKFNLRLQAREQSYQACINRLELRLGLPPTDFNPLRTMLEQ